MRYYHPAPLDLQWRSVVSGPPRPDVMEQQFLSAFAPPKVYQPVPKPSPENLVSSTAEVLLPHRHSGTPATTGSRMSDRAGATPEHACRPGAIVVKDGDRQADACNIGPRTEMNASRLVGAQGGDTKPRRTPPRQTSLPVS